MKRNNRKRKNTDRDEGRKNQKHRGTGSREAKKEKTGLDGDNSKARYIENRMEKREEEDNEIMSRHK